MVYGEGEPHLLGPMLTLLKIRMLPIIGSGSNRWHLVYIGNLVNAFALAMEKEELLEGTFLVADEEILTVREIMNILAKSIKAGAPYSLPGWTAEMFSRIPHAGSRLRFFLKNRTYDISHLKKAGYKPPFSAAASLEKTACYWLEKRRNKNELS
jgi:nucleoside-diphosphate-sugar epimerase